MNIFRADTIEINHSTIQTMRVPPNVKVNFNGAKIRGTHFREDGAETEIETPLNAEEAELLLELVKRIGIRLDTQLSKL